MSSTSDPTRPRHRGPRGLRDPREWHRDYPERMLAGVCASIAENLEISVTVVRALFLIGTLFHGFGVLAYLMMWALIPDRPGEPSAFARWVETAKELMGDGGRRSRRHNGHGRDDDDRSAGLDA